MNTGVPARKIRKPIARTSKKRQTELDQYHNHTKPAYLKDHPRCVICDAINSRIDELPESVRVEIAWLPTCSKTKEAVEIHHKKGRNGKWLNDDRYFLASCTSKSLVNGHQWIDKYSEAAMLLGLVERRTVNKSPMI
jgi:hypothetical protein